MRNVYLDASALVKLAHTELHSSDLRAWLGNETTYVTSRVATTEVMRALARTEPPADAGPVLARCLLIEVDEDVAIQAGRLQPLTMRSLDAIHIASALLVGSALDAFVTYDVRQAEAASDAGLTVESPGQVDAGESRVSERT